MAMTLRLTEEQDKQLSVIAENLGISKNMAVASAVDAYISKTYQRIELRRLSAIILERDAELFAMLDQS